MKLIKITDEHFVIIDESIIPYNPNGGTNGHFLCFDELEYGWDEAYVKNVGNCQACRRILYSTRPVGVDKLFEEVSFTSLTDILEMLESHIKNKAVEYFDTERRNWELEYPDGMKSSPSLVKAYNEKFTPIFVAGYKRCLDDNKEKKYTDKELRDAFVNGALSNLFNTWGISKEDYAKELADSYVQVNQPKTEWDVEFVDGKIKLL